MFTQFFSVLLVTLLFYVSAISSSEVTNGKINDDEITLKYLEGLDSNSLLNKIDRALNLVADKNENWNDDESDEDMKTAKRFYGKTINRQLPRCQFRGNCLKRRGRRSWNVCQCAFGRNCQEFGAVSRCV